MSDKILRAAIVGCGGIANQHSAVLEKLEGARVVACCDVKRERAEAMAAVHGANAYTDYMEMLEKEQIDVVHVTTPHPLHTPIAVAAAKKGINVFTEKPPAAFREQWPEFEALKNSGVKVGICFQNRFNGSVKKMKEILASGELGRPLGARAMVYWDRREPYYTESDWRGSWETEGGGVLINQSIHTLDLMVWLLGAPTGVECHMANHHLRHVMEVDDTVEAYIDFGGVPGLFYATTAYPVNAPVFVEIPMEKGMLRMEGDELEIRRGNGEVEKFEFSHPTLPGKDYWGTGHAACISAFYESVREGAPFQNDIDSVRPTMQLMYDMYEGYRGAPMGKVVKE